MKTGTCTLSFQTGHPGWVFSAVFSATRIISTSQDSKILCMDFAAGLNTQFMV
jgi:F-box and WD-40 domain protein 1/11